MRCWIAIPRTLPCGSRGAAIEQARAAAPVMRRLGATDDVVQLRGLLALCAIADGRLADADAELEQIGMGNDGQTIPGGTSVLEICRAEFTLARGYHPAGLRTASLSHG